MRRCRAQSNEPGTFFADQCWADYTIAMFGIDLRQAQVTAFLEFRADWTVVRQRFRAQALTGVRTALTVCAPDLDDNLVNDVAAIVLNNMKTRCSCLRCSSPRAQQPQET